MTGRVAFLSMTIVLGAVACGRSTTSPSQALNLTGTWNGSIVFQGGPLTARWVATQSGTNLTGPLTLTGQGGEGTGTMTGTLSGTQLTASISMPAGTFTHISPTLSTCAMTANGPLTASAGSLSGTVNSTWTQACVGVISAFATQTGQVTMSK